MLDASIPTPEEVSQSFVAAFAPIVQTWQETSTLLDSWGPDAVSELRPMMRDLYAAFHHAYLTAGTPYGDTPIGMLRWQREMQADSVARERAYNERLSSWCIEDFARQVDHPELPPVPVPQRKAEGKA